jgi:hypothetical protein
LGPFREPLWGGIGFHIVEVAPGSFEFSESLSLKPLGFRQEATIAVSGIDRVLAQGPDTPPALWLARLGGEAKASIFLDRIPQGSLPSEDLTLSGPLEAGAEIRLARGEALEANAWLRADGARAGLRGVAEVDGLTGNLALGKRYRLGRTGPGDNGVAPPLRLSEQVMRAAGSLGARPPGAPSSATQGRFGGGSSLRFRSARLPAGPGPLEVRDFEIDLDLAGGLPVVNRVQAEVLGGTLLGSLGLHPAHQDPDDGFRADARLAFTGLDAARLVPPGGGGFAPGEDTELSGQVAIAVPIRTDLEGMISGLELHAALSHIGARTLDRALYALDPTESNEAIVKQRRLVRIGSPRWVRVEARHGNLSLAGQVAVGGAEVDLPRVERVNLAVLPGMDRLGEALSAAGPALGILRAAAADTLLIDDAGGIQFLDAKGGTAP